MRRFRLARRLASLTHVERCAALVHVLDCGTLESDRDPLSDLAIIEAELEKYAVDMSYAGNDGEVVPLNHRPRLVALNKVDLPDGKDMAEFVRPELESRGYRVFEVSPTPPCRSNTGFAVVCGRAASPLLVREGRVMKGAAPSPRSTAMPSVS